MGYKNLRIGDEKLKGQFETLCAFHTSWEDIADEFGVEVKSLRTWVQLTYKDTPRTVYQRFMQKGNTLLNKSALKLAEKNAHMNIWLRKQWLHEKDPDKGTLDGDSTVEDWTPISEMLKDD